MPTVVVVGTGISGLACASRIATHVDCILIERLPVAGGDDWQRAPVRQLINTALQRGARVVAGTQAVRWDATHVLLLGAENRLQRAHALVVATGHRPLTLAELGIAGERCAGVLPATVATHLLDHGATLGQRPVVVGANARARAIIARLAAQGSNVSAVLPDNPERDSTLPTDHQYPGAHPIAIYGHPRISSVQLHCQTDGQLELACDALILAHGRVPYRNIDGAVVEAPGVVFAQSSNDDPDAAEACGVHAAQRAITLLEQSNITLLIPPRIGVPG